MKKLLLIAAMAAASLSTALADTTTNLNAGANTVVAGRATNIASVTITNTSTNTISVSLWNNPTTNLYAVRQGSNNGGPVTSSHPIGKYFEIVMPPNTWAVVMNPRMMQGLTVSNSDTVSITRNAP